MPRVKIGGQPGSVNDSTSQGGKGVAWEDFKEQLGAIASSLRQLVGNALVNPGSTETMDPLVGPFKLYVNPYIGSDEFVAGSFNSYESTGTDEEKIAQKLKRLSNQAMTCGYSQFRPFRTLNRAIIEVAIITSRDYFTFTDPRAQLDCVSISLSSGRHIIYNQPGTSVGAITPAKWADGFIPTKNHLIAFNPNEGGVIIPRAASFNGDDLRKCVLSPDWVPTPADEALDYSNRSCILRPTPLALGGEFTFVDKIGATTSHHLLDCFAYVSQAQLNTFYDNVYLACGEGGNLAEALMIARPTEYNTVGSFTGSPDATWDTTGSASPYVLNASIRSDYGLCGIFADGDRVGGLKSLVTAQFTGVSLQKDITCWEIYDAGAWRTATSYAELVNASPDDTRKKPARRSWHITAVNDAFIQGVSEFNVGQEGCRTDSGGEITLTNSNSSFGGVAGLSNGYKRAAFPFDKDWAISRITVPVSPAEKVGSIRRTQLGTVASYATGPNRLILNAGLAFDPVKNQQPLVLSVDGYSLKSGTYIWIENPSGPDWRATLSTSAWTSATPGQILVTAAPVDSASGLAVDPSLLVGERVYVRRVVDTRSPAERRCSLKIINTSSARIPERNFVLQTDPSRTGGGVSRTLNGNTELLLVTKTGATAGAAVKNADVTIRRGAPSVFYAANTYYPSGTIVKHADKHYQRLSTGTSVGPTPDPAEWGETLVHMPSNYNAEESRLNESLALTFDTDTAADDDSTTFGINWNTVFTDAGPVRDAYRASTDYRGVHAFLVAMGLSESNAHAALLPRASTARDLDPTSAIDFPTAPAGGAATGRGNWAIEFRRSSVLRMYGHAWEWAGFGGYSKALPRVQQTLSPYNKFTYYFTSANGGRVVPTGSNEDGFAVSSNGLEDIETGEQLSVNDLDGLGIDEKQRTDFPNGIQVGGTAALADVTISGTASFSSQSQAKTTRAGATRLASIAQLTATGSSAAVATTDASLEGSPDAVTVAGLNRWRQAQRLVSAGTDAIAIYVKAGAVERDLNSMLENPPSTAARAIPTLARASEYANSVIGGGNLVAQILIAPGLYDPSSVWECSVRFLSYNSSFTARLFPSNSLGNATTANNFFDGSGYGDFTSAVNFWSFRLILRDRLTSENRLDILNYQNAMFFNRSAYFEGGFHFLGLADTIKAVSQGQLSPGSFMLGGDANFVAPALADYTTSTSTNVDLLLNRLRVLNSRSAAYESWTGENGLITIRGSSAETVLLSDIVFGPGLPSHKEQLGGPRAPLVMMAGAATIETRNIYFRGKTRITSTGMGVTNNLPLANAAHYGSAVKAHPWVWEQTFHTFIGIQPDGSQSLQLRIGGPFGYEFDPNVIWGIGYYQDGTGKLLPNHIHLLNNSGNVPTAADDGPFFDQLIHSPDSLSVVGYTWPNYREDPGQSTVPSVQGFVGRFGSNGYNNTKTRGVIGGNGGILDPETGITFRLSRYNVANNGRSIFRKAGIAAGAAKSTALVTYTDPSSQGFGAGYPAGSNPVIETDTSGSAGLNVGLRSYRRGINAELAITIPQTNVIL